MTALTETRHTKRRTSELFFSILPPPPSKFSPVPWSALMRQATPTPGATATGLTPAGVARAYVDNTEGVAGEAVVDVERGCYSFINNGDIDRTHIGGTAYIVDDQTVAATDGTNTRSAAGTIRDVDADGVWVEI